MTAAEWPIALRELIDEVAKSFEDLDSDSWVERHRLDDHVKPRMTKAAKALKIVTGDCDAADQDRDIRKLLVDAALAELKRQGRCQARTEGGVEQLRFLKDGAAGTPRVAVDTGASGHTELPPDKEPDVPAYDPLAASDCTGPNRHSQATRHDNLKEVASAPADEAVTPPEPSPAGATAVPEGPRPTSDPGLEIDPEFEQLLPALTAEESAQLEQNLIGDQVCSRPFKRWQGTKLLIDGHHRFPICAKHGIPYRIEDIALLDREAVIQWILGNQLGQRNLAPEYVRYARGKLYESRKRQGQRTDLTDVTSGQSGQKLGAAAEIAATSAVSARIVRRAGQYAAAVDAIVSNCGAEARSAILSHDAGLSIQDVGEIAKLPAEEQQKKVKRLVETKRTGKKKRAKGKPTGGDGAANLQGSYEGDAARGAGSSPPVSPKAFLKRLARAADGLAQSVRDLPGLLPQLTATDKAEAKAVGQQITDSAGALTKVLKLLES